MALNYGESKRFDQITTTQPSLKPSAGTGSWQNGEPVDRMGSYGALVNVPYSTSGGVTGGTIKVKVRTAPENVTANASSWVDYQNIVSRSLTGTNPSGVITLGVDLSGADRFISVSVDADPTGGSPASIVAGIITLAGKDRI